MLGETRTVSVVKRHPPGGGRERRRKKRKEEKKRRFYSFCCTKMIKMQWTFNNYFYDHTNQHRTILEW